MAGFQAMKSIAALGAVSAALGATLCSGIAYAGKKAVATEIEVSTANASRDGQVLSCVPQFDGLECFETIVRIGKHPRTAKSSGTEEWSLSCAPQFDGLDCFEIVVSTGKPTRLVNHPNAVEKSVLKDRVLALAPQFDGLHCFETFISKK